VEPLMRVIAIVLASLVLYLQYQAWWGRGGHANVERLRADISRQQTRNEGQRNRNATLEAEVRDLKQGMDAVEELARTEIGMIRQGEVFIQLLEPPPVTTSAQADP
jgi:cell division protein FtsB